MLIRSPIVAVLGHVDHGKSTILDAIRGTSVAAKEAGGITQMIGASYVKKATIDSVAGEMAQKMKLNLTIPGLLFIDTPGHEAFTNLRERGGSIADIAILVVDVTEGFKPQTIESIKILKQYKTPFIVAANKIDALGGWKSYKGESFLSSLAKQPEHIRQRLDEKLYGLMGKLSEYGFDSERFDRVEDFSKAVGIIPTSGKNKEGLSDLLVLIAGLSQKFLEGRLGIEETGRGKGSIIEVKDEKGLGATVDVILYDGLLKKNDEVMFLTAEGVARTKIRGLLEPNMKGGTERFANIESVVAAAGVKIFAPGLEKALPGSPIEAVIDFEKDKKAIEAQFKNVLVQKDEAGVILRADSLGSVEALTALLKEAEIPVKYAGVGKITRRDVLAAKVVREEDKYRGVVIGFNVPILDEARVESKDSGIRIIWSDVIYRALEQYQEWIQEMKGAEKKEMEAKFPWPGKIKVLEGFCFRVSKPAIFGIEVLEGKIKNGWRLMNKNGVVLTELKGMQHDKEKVSDAKPPMQLAISCDGVIFGKDVKEDDVLYVYMTKDEMVKWDGQISLLSDVEKELFAQTKKMLKKHSF
ncbi:MAG: translation initiation factor IF-2 [Candidatus Micrarchaeota archaeon]